MNAPVFPALAPSPEQQASIRLRVLSLGAGVQSTTLALMAAHGEIGPMPDCAIFADTGWEPRAVYEHLAWLRSPNVLPFPVHIVSAGDLRADLLAGARGARWASIPAFTRTVTPAGAELPVYDEDENGDLVAVGSRIVPTERVGVGMIRRQCTGDYKIAPIRRKVRELLGIAGRRSPKAPIAEQWIGISLDEVLRMKPSFEPWQINRWPLIEQGMTRQDCLRWLDRHDYAALPDAAAFPIVAGSDERRLRFERLSLEGRDVDLPFPFAGLGNVIAVLHPHERIHRHAESLFDSERHFRRKMRALVQDGRQCCPRNTENLRRARHRKAKRLDDLTLDKAAGVGGIFHTDALHRTHSHLLVVIFIVEVDNLDFGLVDPERDPPVLGHEKAPGAFSIASELMGLPARDRAQFVFPLHILEEGDDATDFRHYGRLQAGGIIIFDESAQPLMDHVSDSHVP